MHAPHTVAELDKVRAMEQELQLGAQGVGAASCAVLRIGKLKDAAAGTNICELAPGDALQGDVSATAVSTALVQALLRPEAVNATFSAGPASGGGAAADWDDEFVKLVGPEIYRRPFKSAVSADSALLWLREWAREFTRPGSGLTTPVIVVDVRGGVLIRFLQQRWRRAVLDPTREPAAWSREGFLRPRAAIHESPAWQWARIR